MVRVIALVSFFDTQSKTVVLSFFQVKPKPGKSVVKKFHSQSYVNGSECDLTGKARETQVKVCI